MKTLLIAAAAAAIAVPVIAQTAQAPAAQTPMAHGQMKHRGMMATRADIGAHVQTMFARLDTNRDGAVTKAEAQAVRDARRHQSAKRATARGMPDGSARFDRMDANKDGSISRAEFDALHQQRMARRDRDGDGTPDARRGGMRMGKGMAKGMAGLGGHMFDMADADRDGRVTLPEASAAAYRHFDMMDANRDGTISADERKAGRQQMRAHRRQS